MSNPSVGMMAPNGMVTMVPTMGMPSTMPVQVMGFLVVEMLSFTIYAKHWSGGSLLGS